jgi:hypothetical protein
MPWTAADAKKHNKNANTAAKQKKWAATANSVLKETGDDAKAIRVANASIRKS